VGGPTLNFRCLFQCLGGAFDDRCRDNSETGLLLIMLRRIRKPQSNIEATPKERRQIWRFLGLLRTTRTAS
jgi:hypothetical protein